MESVNEKEKPLIHSNKIRNPKSEGRTAGLIELFQISDFYLAFISLD
jgi:hypothetical protein